ncbi:MAG: RNA polymerase sigma factor [Anaerolineales bacterium]|nr:RNA polymerase sigma factor [Anaerolineales bacterium]
MHGYKRNVKCARMQEERMTGIKSPLKDFSQQADEQLARQARGDPDAFAELFHRHAAAVNRYLFFKTGSADDAQDLTSQTFLAALENIERYRGQGSWRGWLFGIARHKLMDHYRQRRPDVGLELAHGVHDSQPAPEEQAGLNLQFDQVGRALQRLSADQSEALCCRVFAGLSAAETARVMDKSEAAVKMLVFRGLGKLREQLALTQEVL